jgi:hypothetical protein
VNHSICLACPTGEYQGQPRMTECLPYSACALGNFWDENIAMSSKTADRVLSAGCSKCNCGEGNYITGAMCQGHASYTPFGES